MHADIAMVVPSINNQTIDFKKVSKKCDYKTEVIMSSGMRCYRIQEKDFLLLSGLNTNKD